MALWTVRYYALFDQTFPDSLRCRRCAAAGAPTRPHARERPRAAPSRGADSTPPPATACARGMVSRTTTSSSSSAASSASAARSGPRKPPPHCGTAAAVETNLVTFSSASGGVRNEPAPPHRSRRRRRARRARALTRQLPPRHCAKSAGAAAFDVMSSTADLRSWVGHTAGTDALCSAAAAVDAVSGLWRAERHHAEHRKSLKCRKKRLAGFRGAGNPFCGGRNSQWKRGSACCRP